MKLDGVLDNEVPVWALMVGAPAAVDEAGALKAMCASSVQEKGKLLQRPEGVVVCVKTPSSSVAGGGGPDGEGGLDSYSSAGSDSLTEAAARLERWWWLRWNGGGGSAGTAATVWLEQRRRLG